MNSQYSGLTGSSKCYVTSTPCVTSSTADNGENCYSNSAVDSGYFTRSKAALSKSSVAVQHRFFPPLNLDITEGNIGPASDTDYIDESQIDLSECREIVEHEYQSRISDFTNIYSTPDVMDRLATSVDSASESHSSGGHDQHPIAVQQPVDIISQLLPCFPHIVSLIFCYVSDSDLCR